MELHSHFDGVEIFKLSAKNNTFSLQTDDSDSESSDFLHKCKYTMSFTENVAVYLKFYFTYT